MTGWEDRRRRTHTLHRESDKRIEAMSPSMISMPPARQKKSIPKKGVSSRQREIHQGTKPATKPGAMTKKIAERTIANTSLNILI